MTRSDVDVARAGAGAGTAGFCRVTLLAPRTRIDLALPTDLTVAELVPMLMDLAGESGARRRGRSGGPADRQVEERPSAWCLAAAAGAELAPSATLAGLGVLDGDLLRLRRRADAPPPPVFDDPVDALAESVRGPDGTSAWGGPEDDPAVPPPWDGRCRRIAGLVAGAAALIGAAVLLASARAAVAHAGPVAAALAALAAVGALTTALRAGPDDPAAGVVLAAGAIPLAAAAGLAALPGPPAAAHLLLAAALATATAAAGLVVLGTPAPVLVATVLAGATAALAGLLGVLGGGRLAGLAAGAATVGVGLLPLLPRLSVRLAGLPPPVIPTTPEDMIAADGRWEFASPEELRYQSRLAHAYLSGLVLGASAVAGVGAVLAALAGGWAGALFSVVVVAVLLLRSRGYVTALACWAPMAAGLTAGSALLGGLAVLGTGVAALAVAPALLVAAALAVGLVRAGPDRASSPVLRRAVDVLESVLVVATFPLALWVLDLYRLVRQL